MQMSFEIVPSILVKTYQQFVRRLRQVEPFVKTVHLDVMDGKFVNNVTFADPLRIGRLKHKLQFGAHMMVVNPEEFVDVWSKAGASRYIFHIEAAKDPLKLVKEIKSTGMKVGVALNPETSVSAVERLLVDVDMVLVMSVAPGLGGQKFRPEALVKIEELKKMRPELLVGVDGGVNLFVISRIREAGADFAVAGTAIYGAKDIGQAIRDLTLAM